jgi:hypothetical protein
MGFMRRAIWLAIGPVAFAALVAVAEACGGGSADVGPEGDGGGEASTSPDGDVTPPSGGDASTTDDGGEAEGGANFDGGDLGGDDAGPDGGPCNEILNEAPAVASSCVSAIPVFSGGPLVAGTYYLTAVSAIGSKAFCKNTFLPVGFRQTMQVKVDATGTATAEVATQIAGGVLRHTTVTFSPKPGDATPAVGQSVCPARPAGDVPYTSAIRLNKQILTVVLPYGAGIALYRYERQ